MVTRRALCTIVAGILLVWIAGASTGCDIYNQSLPDKTDAGPDMQLDAALDGGEDGGADSGADGSADAGPDTDAR